MAALLSGRRLLRPALNNCRWSSLLNSSNRDLGGRRANLVIGKQQQHVRCFSAETTTAASSESKPSLSGPPPPGPSKFESVRATFSGELSEASYKVKLRETYGDVACLWVFQNLMFVFDPEIYMSILRQEWSLPYGAAPSTWPLVQYYLHRSPDCMPMMLIHGEEWKAPRQTLQTHMFSPKAADSYQPGITSVVDDCSNYLRQNPYPQDLNQFLCNASFEMLAQILLERRMGLLDDSSGPMERQFVNSAVDAFHAVGALLTFPPVTNIATLRCIPEWNKLESNMDKVWDIGMQWLEETEETRPEAALVTKLATEGKMDRQERLVNLVTILQAGVDTTSNSLAWALYQLAKRPEEQERLRAELNRVLPARRLQARTAIRIAVSKGVSTRSTARDSDCSWYHETSSV